MKPNCPKCGWTTTHRSVESGWVDKGLRLFGLLPFRCRSCGRRFFRFAFSQSRATGLLSTPEGRIPYRSATAIRH